jgi:hypothetical protein
VNGATMPYGTRRSLAATPPGAVVLRAVRASGEPEPEAGEETWRLWLEAPDRLRAEFAVGTEMVTAWFSGGTWWSWSPSQGARTNEGRQNMGHGKGPGEVRVSPAPLTQVLDFELLGELTVLSRRAYRLRARPRVGTGADLGRPALVQVKNPEQRRGIPLSATIAYLVRKPGEGQGNLLSTPESRPGFASNAEHAREPSVTCHAIGQSLGCSPILEDRPTPFPQR